MGEGAGGVQISMREIYDTMQEIKNEVKSISPAITQLQKDAQKGVEAHDKASKALELAVKHDNAFKWIWRAVGLAIITALVGWVLLMIQMGITSQIQKTIEQPIIIKEETQ